jgi:hypothetical protein
VRIIRTMSARPRLFDFVRTDFISLFLALLVPVSLGIAGWAALKLPVFAVERMIDERSFETMDPGAARIFVGIAAASAVLLLVVLALRLRGARSAFRGIFVPGRISKITQFKDRACLHFHYAHDSLEFDAWRFVHQTAAVKALQVGQDVQVALDPKRPNAAWVAELFE